MQRYLLWQSDQQPPRQHWELNWAAVLQGELPSTQGATDASTQRLAGDINSICIAGTLGVHICKDDRVERFLTQPELRFATWGVRILTLST